MYMEIENCSSCGEDHDQVLLVPLDEALYVGDYFCTLFYVCPDTGKGVPAAIEKIIHFKSCLGAHKGKGKTKPKKHNRKISQMQLNFWAAQTEEWNKKYQPGQKVYFMDDLGRYHKTFTRTPVWQLGWGKPVVSIDGRTGGIDLDRIVPFDWEKDKV